MIKPGRTGVGFDEGKEKAERAVRFYVGLRKTGPRSVRGQGKLRDFCRTWRQPAPFQACDQRHIGEEGKTAKLPQNPTQIFHPPVRPCVVSFSCWPWVPRQ